MAHIVKCCYCGKSFDRDIITCKQVGRRYAHLECYIDHEANKTKDEKDLEELQQYIMKLFNESFINPKIKRQLESYRKDYNYSYSGIHKALVYAFEVKNNDIKKANGGIGIVPYVYNDAYRYYYNLWLVQQQNKDKNINDYILEVKEFKITPPERKPMRKKRFSFLDMEDEDVK